MAYEAKAMISRLFDLDSKSPKRRKEYVQWLLTGDRFTCHSSKREVVDPSLSSLPPHAEMIQLTPIPQYRNLDSDSQLQRSMNSYMRSTSLENASLA
jgi:hypothetical protein